MLSREQQQELAAIIAVIEPACELLRRWPDRRQGLARKDDDTPSTDADRAAEETVLRGLSSLARCEAIHSEESYDPATPATPDCWLVDPLDGTRNFVSGGSEYTINVAQIRNSRPVLGVIALPENRTFYAARAGGGAWCVRDGEFREMRCRLCPVPGAVVVSGGRTLPPAARDWLRVRSLRVQRMWKTAAAGKYARIAEGLADLLLRRAPCSEWDIAAGDLLIHEAGGQMSTLAGRSFTYGQQGLHVAGVLGCGAGWPQLAQLVS